MASDEHYGAIIEFVNGESARDAFKNGGAMPIKQTFHETLVFAFLAGLDDLHRDNVFWSADGRPFLIDADNVASMNQMLQKDHGAKVQSGFGYESDDKGAVHPSAVAYHQEAEKKMKAIRDEDQTFNSKILAAMLTDDGKRTEIWTSTPLGCSSSRPSTRPSRRVGSTRGSGPGSVARWARATTDLRTPRRRNGSNCGLTSRPG